MSSMRLDAMPPALRKALVLLPNAVAVGLLNTLSPTRHEFCPCPMRWTTTRVQIFRSPMAHRIWRWRGADRLAVAKTAGSDELIDSAATQDLRNALKPVGPPEVIYYAVGRQQAEAALRSLRPEGRHLLIGFASRDLPVLRPNQMLVKNIDVIGLNWGGYPTFDPTAMTDSLNTLVTWFCEGRIRPHIGNVLTLIIMRPKALISFENERRPARSSLPRKCQMRRPEVSADEIDKMILCLPL